MLRPYDRGQMVGEKLGQLPAQPFHIHPAAAKQTLTVGVDGVDPISARTIQSILTDFLFSFFSFFYS